MLDEQIKKKKILNADMTWSRIIVQVYRFFHSKDEQKINVWHRHIV